MVYTVSNLFHGKGFNELFDNLYNQREYSKLSRFVIEFNGNNINIVIYDKKGYEFLKGFVVEFKSFEDLELSDDQIQIIIDMKNDINKIENLCDDYAKIYNIDIFN